LNLKNFIHILTVGILIFTITACEIFTGTPDEELIDKIDGEIAWANADKVTVRVAYPPEWGTSPQYAGFDDIRVGYEFDVGFSAFPEYAMLEWRAYKTTELIDPELGEEWLDNPARFFDVDKRAQQVDRESVTLPAEVAQAGGTGKVTVNTTEPVTLVPFCRAQPRIVRSTPDGTQMYYGRSRPISIIFASALNDKTVIIGADNIRIWRRPVENGQAVGDRIFIDKNSADKQYYDVPEYIASERMIIINPLEHEDGIGPPSNSEITLRLGTAISTIGGGTWRPADIVEIKWRTRSNSCRIDNWTARYQNGKIYLEWTQVGADSSKVRIQRRAGLPVIDDININDPTITSCEIEIPSLQNNERFDIRIDLTSDGEIFAMEDDWIMLWAIPDGMEVISAKPARVVNQENHKEWKDWRLTDPDQIFVLDESIEAGDWTSIGSDSENAFMGTFYGLGNTITFSGLGNFNSSPYTGIFGYTNNARIYDLNVVYTNMTINYTGGDLYAGGIVGYAAGGTVIRNSTVSGGALTASGSNNVYIGGLVGYSENSSITNSYFLRDITITGGSNVFAGGIAGSLSAGGISSSFVKSSINASGANVYAGGIAGNAESGAYIYNSVMLGDSVSGANAYRILGLNSGASLSNNYARGAAILPRVPVSAHDGQDGGSVTATRTTQTYFWTDLSFSGAYWDFGSLLRNGNEAGHPLLLGMANQEVKWVEIHGRVITTVVTGDNTSKHSIQGPSIAEAGEDVTFTGAPAKGYSVRSFGVTGGVANPSYNNAPYTFTMPDYDVTVTANITANVYNVVKGSEDISVGTFAAANQTRTDQPATITATPVDGWKVSGMTANAGAENITVTLAGGNDPRTGTFTVTEPNFAEGAVITVNVAFERIAHQFNPSPLPSPVSNGTITSVMVNGSAVSTLRIGDEVTVNVEPALGWKLSAITLNSTAYPNTVSAQLADGADPRSGTFTMPGYPVGTTVTINAVFEKITHNINVNFITTGSGGHIVSVLKTPAGGTEGNASTTDIEAQLGDTLKITVAPVDTGGTYWTVDQITSVPVINGATTVKDDSTGGATYIFTMPAFGYSSTPINISVEFNSAYLISLASNGTVAPGGTFSVNLNKAAKDTEITININSLTPGYRVITGGMVVSDASTPVSSVTDPVTGAITSGTFIMPAAPVTVSVGFEKIPYTIIKTPTDTSQGTFTVTPMTATFDQTVTISTEPQPGWRVKESGGINVTIKRPNNNTPESLSVTPVNQNNTITGGTFTIGNSGQGFPNNSEVTVTVLFEKIPYVINPVVTGPDLTDNYSWFTVQVGGNVKTTLYSDDTVVTITATPKTGWKVKENGVTITPTGNSNITPSGSGNSYTFGMQAYPNGTVINVTVVFEMIPYTITKVYEATEGAFNMTIGGVANPNPLTATYEQNVVIVPTPAANYRVDAVKVYKTSDLTTPVHSFGENGPYNFSMPDYHVTVEVMFSNVYTITSAAASNGSFTVNGGLTTQTYNQSVTISPTPNSNYRVGTVSVYKTGEPTTTVSHSGSGNGPYSFNMPAYHVTVAITFIEDASPSPAPPMEPSANFNIQGTDNIRTSTSSTSPQSRPSNLTYTARTTSARATPTKATPTRTTPARTTPAKETPAKETPAKETPAGTTAMPINYRANEDRQPLNSNVSRLPAAAVVNEIPASTKAPETKTETQIVSVIDDVEEIPETASVETSDKSGVVYEDQITASTTVSSFSRTTAPAAASFAALSSEAESAAEAQSSSPAQDDQSVEIFIQPAVISRNMKIKRRKALKRQSSEDEKDNNNQQ